MPKPVDSQKRNLILNTLRKVLPSFILNVVFIIQAIQFDWRLGTMVWIYWLQGLIILLIGLLASRQRFGWMILLTLMVFYGFFLTMLTFPSSDVTYLKNGVVVAAEEITVLSNTQWNLVFINVSTLMVGYIYFWLSRKDTSEFSGSEVVKRIIPLHITIVLASFVPWSVLLFLALRSAFDVLEELGVMVIKTGEFS